MSALHSNNMSKSPNCTCYYLDNIIKFEDFDFDVILIDEKLLKSNSIYNSSYMTLIGSKTLCISFDKIDGVIKVYDGIKYLVLFGLEKYDAIYNRIWYLISQGSGYKHVFSHSFAVD